MPESDETKTTFRLPKTLLRELKRYAIDHDTNATKIFSEALREYLDRRKKGRTQEN